MVSCPLGPSSVATAAEEGGQTPGRAQTSTHCALYHLPPIFSSLYAFNGGPPRHPQPSLLTFSPKRSSPFPLLRALRRYTGPAVPGNQDPQTNQIVHSHPFSLTSRSSAIDFTEKVLGGMAAYDRRKRLTLGEAVDHNNEASIVVDSLPFPPLVFIIATPPPSSAFSVMASDHNGFGLTLQITLLVLPLSD